MYAYKLPNGVRVDAERLADAVLAESEYPQVYLDTELGALVEIPSREALGHWVEEIGDTDRYLLVERFSDAYREENARYFLEELWPEIDPAAGAALADGGWPAFEEWLERDAEGWVHAWDQFLSDQAWEYVREWLTKNPRVKIREEFEGCGNCALCELMRTGEDGDPAKLLEAFKTEKVMQNITRQLASQKQKQERVDMPRSGREKGVAPQRTAEGSVYTFKITLNDSRPQVWRRIEVPAGYTFFDLHCAIQDAMGWTDSHLHAFRVDTRSQTKAKRGGGRGAYISIKMPDPEFDDDVGDTRDERTERIADWFGPRITQCVYEYDFGDSWDHTILLEGMKPAEAGTSYPRCTAGKNACPPEDCGGVGGYDDLQRIMKNPSDPEHEETKEWLCLDNADEFDPKAFDPADVEFEDPKELLSEYEERFR